MQFIHSLLIIFCLVLKLASFVQQVCLRRKEKMNFLTIFFFSILFHFCFSFQDTEDLTLRINDGEILGRYITSHSGRTISAFMGIPFARPPVGDLRFKAPQKAVPWNGTLLTQNEPPKCPQIDTFAGLGTPRYEGNEDCLYLNVYVPEKSTSGLLDVLVWIHGGVIFITFIHKIFYSNSMHFQAFVLGSGGRSSYGPDYLLDHDVILVAGNYRLGLLGFLSTEDEHATGNFGLKDQSFLLQWVQENIEHFGGNKSSVTIWGGKYINADFLNEITIEPFYEIKSQPERYPFIIKCFPQCLVDCSTRPFYTVEQYIMLGRIHHGAE